MKQTKVRFLGTAVTGLGTFSTGDERTFDAAFAKHLVEEAKAAEYVDVQTSAQSGESGAASEPGGDLATDIEAYKHRLADEAAVALDAEMKRLADNAAVALEAEKKRLADEAAVALNAEMKRLADEANDAVEAEKKRLAEAAKKEAGNKKS